MCFFVFVCVCDVCVCVCVCFCVSVCVRASVCMHKTTHSIKGVIVYFLLHLIDHYLPLCSPFLPARYK